MEAGFKNIPFEKLKQQAGLLSPDRKKELISYLRNSYSIFTEQVNVDTCPHCTSKHIVKNGRRNGYHKYICRNCKKNFTYRTGTILSSVQKLNAWNLFVEDFMSLNITSLKQLKQKLGVSEQTVFNWRHKLLSALTNREVNFKDENAEYDETLLLISRKGRQGMEITKRPSYRGWRKGQSGDTNYQVKVFFTYGRNSKQLDLYKSGMGRTTKEDLKRYFTTDKFTSVTIYCDRHSSYKGFFEDNGISYQNFISTHHRSWENRDVHNQTINAYMKDFKSFVNRHLKGVSTKYLNSYINWFMFIHEIKQQVDKQIQKEDKIKFNITDRVCKEIIGDSIGLEKYRMMEIDFQVFLRDNDRTDYGICRNHYYAKAA